MDRETRDFINNHTYLVEEIYLHAYNSVFIINEVDKIVAHEIVDKNIKNYEKSNKISISITEKEFIKVFLNNRREDALNDFSGSGKLFDFNIFVYYKNKDIPLVFKNVKYTGSIGYFRDNQLLRYIEFKINDNPMFRIPEVSDISIKLF